MIPVGGEEVEGTRQHSQQLEGVGLGFITRCEGTAKSLHKGRQQCNGSFHQPHHL